MRFLKRSLIGLIVFLPLLAFAWTVFTFWAHDKYVVPILMYHGVEPADSKGKLNLVSPQSFDRQMAFLKNNGYRVISLYDLVDGIDRGRMFSRKDVVITFDDGYEDNYTHAFAVLKQFEFPATVFVISDTVGTPGFMTWPQLKEIDEAGFKVGSHTRRHAYLPGVTNEAELEDEIINSKGILEKNLGKPVLFFSYPSGGFSEHIKSIVKKAGYQGACSTNRGYDRFNNDLYELKRIRVNDDDSSLVLRAKLSGYYNLFRKQKNPH